MYCFYKLINNCISHNVPTVKTANKSNKTHYPMYIRRKLSRKASAWRVFKQFRTSESHLSYKKLSSDCRSLIYKHSLQRERNVINSGSVSNFYRHCNKRFNCRSVIGPIKQPDGSIV